MRLTERLRNLYRKLRGSKRLYKYGTCGLHIYDDRNIFEKVLDYCDRNIDNLLKSHPVKEFRARWHPFFDIATGRMIESMADIKKIEREKGWTYMDKSDIQKEAKRNMKYNIERQKNMIRKDLSERIRKINQGYSYVREMNERIKKGEYGVGQRSAFNG